MMQSSDVQIYWMVIPEDAKVRDIEQRLDILTAEERAVYDRYRVDFKKIEFLMGRLMLKNALANQLGLEPSEIVFEKNKYGKLFLIPEVKERAGRDLFFNLSHGGKMVAMVVTPFSEAGIDVEKVREQHLDLMKTVFMPEEIAHVLTFEGTDRQREFYQIWTRKEAFVKAVGMGLSIPPDAFSVPLVQGTCTQEDWEYHTFLPEGEHVLSVAVNKSNKDEEPEYRTQEVLFADLLRAECKL